MIFKRHHTAVGMEVDFANELGRELRRPVNFVELERKELIPSLEKGKIDIIMSAVIVDDEKQQKVAFAMPWTSLSVMLLFRERDTARLRSTNGRYAIEPSMKIGVCRGSTGERMVRRYMSKFDIVLFDEDEQAVHRLRKGLIDCYLRDSQEVWSIANSRDPQLTGIYWPFPGEKIAWAVNRDDLVLRKKINKILDKWRLNGKREEIMRKWLPYKKSL